MWRRIGAVAAAALVPSVGLCEETYIACSITSTYNFATGASVGSSGSDVYVVRTKSDGTADYTLPFGCVDGTAQVDATETQIEIRCDQQLGNITWQRLARIDRVTGEYMSAVALKGKDGLVHSGTCAKQQRKF